MIRNADQTGGVVRALRAWTLAAALLARGPAPPAIADAPRAPQPAPAAPGGPPVASTDRFCPVCGARNKGDSRFCLKDGTPLPALDPDRRAPGFVRSAGTYAPEEIQEVMQRVSRSVVRIRVHPTTTYKYPIVYWKDEEAEYFHRAMLGRIETSDADARLSGSGFMIDEDGAIVTNAHVASPDNQKADLTVELPDGRSVPARVVGVDAASDLALITIDAGPMAPLDWADSGAVRVGQETWAIGNPLDIGTSIARGTMSGISATRIGLNQVESFLHSDAHITHGNSGGPLVDVYGHVLGVSDIVVSEARGQGYSIPSRMARLVIDRLTRDGRYDRGFIGLQVHPIDSDMIDQYSLKRSEGSVVEWVLPGTPAQSAGLLPGDVVYGINGRQAASSYVLQEAISSLGPGASATLLVDRHGRNLSLPVTTILRPAAPRVDPLQDLQNYLRVRFEEDSKKGEVYIRNGLRSHRAPGLYDGFRVKSVLPAQDWPEEPVNLNYYKTRAKPVRVESLEDLRGAFRRAYVGGRVAVTFEIDYPPAPIASVAFDEVWPIVL